MINITVKKRKGSYLDFLSKGHAGYAEEGQDIVCAAVSALIITTVNSLEKFTEEQIEAEADEGYVSIHFKTNPNTERGKLLMDSLILGLTEIEHSYNNRYLTVRVKRPPYLASKVYRRCHKCTQLLQQVVNSTKLLKAT